MIERLTTPRRLLFAFFVIVCVTFAAQAREVAQREGAFYKGGDVPVGSDFNAFYSAGRIVEAGDGEHLYSLARQQFEQRRTLGTDNFDGFQPFAYPAFVAIPYALIAKFPFLWAYGINTALMLGTTCAAVMLLRPVSQTVRFYSVIVTLAILASQPLTATIFGGQTAAFSLFCLSGTYVSLRRGHNSAAGLTLGALFYKPQLAIPLVLLLLWRRQWHVCAVAGIVGIAYSILGALVAGPRWPREFMELAGGDFYSIEAYENGANMISFLGVAEQVFGPKAPLAYVLSGLASLAVLAVLLIAWRGAQLDEPNFPLHFGLAIAVTLMINPHAMFYEASLLILPVIFLIDYWSGSANPAGGLNVNHRVALICAFAVGFLWPLGALTGIHPFFVLPLSVAIVTMNSLRTRLRPRLGRGGLHLPVGVLWGESPNASSGKRS